MIQCIRGYAAWPPPEFANRGTALALGIFDDVHLGHQALLRAVPHWAAQDTLVPVEDTEVSVEFGRLLQKRGIAVRTRTKLTNI